MKPSPVEEIKEALDKVEGWKKYRSTTDRGSYVEKSSDDYDRANAIIKAYNDLIHALEQERLKE